MAEPPAAAPAREGRTLVVEPLPGIGDLIWHLPHLHALAAASPDRRVSLLTKPRSRADRLLRADPAIDEVRWLERGPGRHDGPLGLLRLARELRAGAWRRIWILHQSSRYHWAARLAGIPERHGYGLGVQRWLQSRPLGVGSPAPWHPIEKADRLLEVHGIARTEAEPTLVLDPAQVASVAARHASWPRPWIALGIGTSEPSKQWGEERFGELARALRARHGGTVVLVGGPAEAALARRIAARGDGAGGVVAVTDLPVDEIAALLAGCALYAGNDTGFLNVAAAVGVDAIGLFGSSPPLGHSARIHPVVPPGGAAPGYGADRMAEIAVETVLDLATRRLARTEARRARAPADRAPAGGLRDRP